MFFTPQGITGVLYLLLRLLSMRPGANNGATTLEGEGLGIEQTYLPLVLQNVLATQYVLEAGSGLLPIQKNSPGETKVFVLVWNSKGHPTNQ